MRSIGMDLEKWVKKRLLEFHAVRPTLYGLETHLASFQRAMDEFEPRAVIFDPLSSLLAMGSHSEVRSALLRVVDLVKSRAMTGVFTSLYDASATNQRDLGVSSLMDTWLAVRDIEVAGERNRGLYIIKSRGMNHSNQIREFLITSEGVRLQDVYIGAVGVLTGSARIAQEARDDEERVVREQEFERERLELERRRVSAEAQIAALQAEAEAAKAELERLTKVKRVREMKDQGDRTRMAASRQAGRSGKSE